MKDKEIKKADAVYGKYTGKKRFIVRHPTFGRCTVYAPDDNAAIVAAAQFWEQKWTSYSFYPECVVTKDC